MEVYVKTLQKTDGVNSLSANKLDRQSSSIPQQMEGPTSVIKKGGMRREWVADIKRGKERQGHNQPINLHKGILVF